MQKETILQKLTMTEVLLKYSPCKILHNRADCPLHGGDNCFRIYENSFYCFSCGKGGDLIKFVSLLFNINYRQAMFRLDYDFGLGIFHKMTVKEHEAIRSENSKIKAERERKESIRKLSQECYNALCEYFWELREASPDANVIEQCVIVNRMIDYLNEHEDFIFDYNGFINVLKERRNEKVG